MEWSFVAVGPVDAHVDVPAGEVNVESGGESAIDVSLEPLGLADQRALELIASSRVSFDAGRLEVHVPSRKLRNVELVCTITMPAGSDLEVRTASADVRVPVRTGRFTAKTASGDISLARADGDIAVTTASGNFECAEAGSDLRVRAASGDVTVRRLGGRADLSLASGDARVDDAGGSVSADTASGDVQVGRAREGEIRVRTASGDISVLVAPGTGAYLDVTSVSGEMSCTLPFDESSPEEAKLSILCQSVSGDVSIAAATA